MQNKPAIGSRVIIAADIATAKHQGVVYIVEKHSPVNVIVRRENPDGSHGVSINPMYLRPAPPAGTAPTTPTVVEIVPYEQPLAHGTVVTTTGPLGVHPVGTLRVVVAESTGGRYRIARLGGEDGPRYWRANRRGLVPVAPSRITLLPA